ncbi:class I SAM-dependent methyltransferase [Candidatus Kaiserbacteria bacterium]|nr:class I SAM-dependent methyltransferase [Candidatus Kaiserbacteria bacterium]
MNPDPKKFYNERMPHKLGADYEHARWHANAFQEAQYAMMQEVMRSSVIPLAKDARRILEVGPGSGTWTKFLLKANETAEYTLLDISAEMLSRAQASLPHSSPVSYVENDFLAYESAEKFDLIFSSRALEYIPDKPAAVRKIASLLLPNGTAVIITKMPKPFFEKVSGRKTPDLHTGQIAPPGLIRLFQENGLRLRLVRIATATLPGFKSPFLNRITHQLLSGLPLIAPFRIFAESYIIVASKPS